jgi:hypothetical protein
VQKMPYTTPWGESGWYTGEVNDGGKPHGQGRMRIKTGNIVDGNWINGYSEEYLEKQKRMKSGFGTNIAKWKQNAASPHYEPASRPTSKGMPLSNARSGVIAPHSQYGGPIPHPSHWHQGYSAPTPSSMCYPEQQQYWQHSHSQLSNPDVDSAMLYGQMPPHHYR